MRQTQAAPIMADFKAWLDKARPTTPPKSPLGKAINYCLNQWHKLSRYLEDGHLSIDNNRAERAIKPFVIGRKNWLFNQPPRGAQASAILYSLTQTAKANDLDSYDYLVQLLTELPALDKDACLEHLMPWNIKRSA